MRLKIYTAAALVAVIAPAVLQAQTSATVTASATVQASLTATAQNQLNFGTLQMGVDGVISSTGTGALGTPTTAGRGQVHVQHNSGVNVTASFPNVLTRTGGATLGFAPSCTTSSTSGGTGADTTDCTAFSLTAAAPGAVQDSYILVGGTVSANSASGIGVFSGDIVFTLTSTN